LSLHFPKGQLSLICGRLGSGKSLLLAGLLGEADLLAGHVECPRSSPNAMASQTQEGISEEDWVVPGMLAYVPQQAWLQNASIKDNIVFSSPWDERRYEAVLEACSLLSDLQILEDGDQT
jgi:ABC-type transport system involved in cytochrome bd biosynthesis fused ATPase/permease subunit